MAYNNLLEFLYDSNNKAKSTLAGVQSVIEYCRALRAKVTEFISTDVTRDNTDSISIVVPDLDHDNAPRLVQLTKSNLEAAISEDSEDIILSCNDQGGTIRTSNDEVISAVQEQLQEVTLQEEFLDYVTNSTQELKASDLASSIGAKYPGISGANINKYTQLISTDSVSTLQNFFLLAGQNVFETHNTGESNEYTAPVNVAEYDCGPNVFVTAITQITTAVTDKFTEAFKNIHRIKDFFIAIGKGLVNIISFLAEKLFSNLTTIYSKGDKRFGVMDFPIAQFNIGTLVEQQYQGKKYYSWIDDQGHSQNIAGGIKSNLDALPHNNIPYNQNGHYCMSSKIYGVSATNDIPDFVSHCNDDHAKYLQLKTCASMQLILKNLVHLDDLGNEVIMPYDVLIPTSSTSNMMFDIYPVCDLVARVTVSDDLKVWVSLFMNSSYDEWNAYDDYQNYLRIMDSFVHCSCYLMERYDVLPYRLHNYTEPYYSLISQKADTNQDMLYMVQRYLAVEPTEPASHNNYNFVSNLKFVTYDTLATFAQFREDQYSDFSIDDNAIYFDLFNCFVVSLMSELATQGPADWPENILVRDSNQSVLMSSSDAVGKLIYGYSSTTLYPASDNDRNLRNFGISVSSLKSIYRPYVKYSLTPSAIHFQTYQQQVDEAKRTIIGVIVAVAATVITIKLLKFRKTRIHKAALAEADLETYKFMMFDGEHQTSYSEYMRRYKKARKINRFNALLGISSAVDIAESTNNHVSGTLDALKGMTGREFSENSLTLADVNKNIVGS